MWKSKPERIVLKLGKDVQDLMDTLCYKTSGHSLGYNGSSVEVLMSDIDLRRVNSLLGELEFREQKQRDYEKSLIKQNQELQEKIKEFNTIFQQELTRFYVENRGNKKVIWESSGLGDRVHYIIFNDTVYKQSTLEKEHLFLWVEIKDVPKNIVSYFLSQRN